jgi:hypothetical protein
MYPLRLSHSSTKVLHECERKFEIEKLLVGGDKKQDNEHFSFGHAYGAGVATYLVTQDQDAAIFECWLRYWPEIETEKKSVHMSVLALINSFVTLDNILQDYEVAFFNGKPAVELSFRLDISKDFYFVGHIDIVLQNRYTKKYFVVDAKSTGLNLLDVSPLYRHSGQTVGYSIALDAIVGEELTEFGVGYVVAQIDAKNLSTKTHFLTYEKNITDRLKWFMTLGMDAERISRMQELKHFPMREDSCVRFNRTCRHFGTCHMHALDQYKELEEDPIEYDFHYQLDDLIENHLRRVPAMSVAQEFDTLSVIKEIE